MRSGHHVAPPCAHRRRHETGAGLWRRLYRLCFPFVALIGGGFGLLWLLIRSGSRPSRMTYPCQQAALSAASLALAAPLAAALDALRGRLGVALGGRFRATACGGLGNSRRTRVGAAVAGLGLVIAATAWGLVAGTAAYSGPVMDTPADYRARVYHVSRCPQDPIGDRFVGLDRLLVLMGREDLKFYRSPRRSLVGGPDGIVAADDVVVIKINYQWSQRGGTNTDLLRGLIRRIVDHPDAFAGEVVVCENAQFQPVENFDRAENNAQNHAQSPHDVVEDFRRLGYNVSHYDWTAIRFTQVGEYSENDERDGYIVYPYNPEVQGRVSYPKFRTQAGTYISLKNGVWDPVRQTYDREHLKFINVPVLKSHGTYGATACVKLFMGVVTSALSTNSHNAIQYGILGAVMGEVRPPDLNILDCIWINAIPERGPSTPYNIATRRDELVASRDPIAADIWAVKYILTPAFRENGYPPPWPKVDPDDPNSTFRIYLDRSMSFLLRAGFEATNDLNKIDAFTWNGIGDDDRDGDVDLADYAGFHRCHEGPGVEAPPGCEAVNFNDDPDVDLEDAAAFEHVFTGPGTF